jgi:L-lactate dehydrogenase complex protein LldF
VCPVYKNVGGYAYGWFISGPIGAIFTPQILGTQAARELPFASTLCGACVDVCPVKIPITKILLHLRQNIVEGSDDQPPTAPTFYRTGAKIGRLLLRFPWLYNFGTQLLAILFRPFQKAGWINFLPPPANRWTGIRPLPMFQGSFRQWWKRRINMGLSREEN